MAGNIELDSTLSWKDASGDNLVLLGNLQPNIVKAHVREFLSVLFLRFDDQSGGRAFVGAVGAKIKSALDHLREIEAFKTSGTPGTPYVGLGLSSAGYAALGLATMPADASFRAGMQETRGLNDPDIGDWEAHFQRPADLHAVLLVGDMLQGPRDAALADIEALIAATPGVSVLGVQTGLGQHNDNREGIEHFGYVDGRSQPLFLVEDIAAEEDGTDGTANWSPGCPLGQVIVSDPAAPDPGRHFGSYFIFRKLEQNVKLFKSQERELASRLPIPDAMRAGAMLVGRFEDGTPVTMQSASGVESPVPNNFNYNSDSGGKCPFLGHIRKTNPRGSGGFGQTEAQERSHIMARRGQTYGVRTDNANDGLIDNKPEADVGLLFMAFNSDIQHQFEFTQITWANNPNFPEVPGGVARPGLDPIIGQMPNNGQRPNMALPLKWGSAASASAVAPVPQTVTMKGGQYFFMPSLAFLRGLQPKGAK